MTRRAHWKDLLVAAKGGTGNTEKATTQSARCGVSINKASVAPSRVEAPKTGFAGMWMVQQEELGRVTKPFFKW